MTYLHTCWSVVSCDLPAYLLVRGQLWLTYIPVGPWSAVTYLHTCWSVNRSNPLSKPAASQRLFPDRRGLGSWWRPVPGLLGRVRRLHWRRHRWRCSGCSQRAQLHRQGEEWAQRSCLRSHNSWTNSLLGNCKFFNYLNFAQIINMLNLNHMRSIGNIFLAGYIFFSRLNLFGNSFFIPDFLTNIILILHGFCEHICSLSL